MTIDERVRKIFETLQLPTTYDQCNGIPKGAYKAIAAQLREVEREASQDIWGNRTGELAQAFVAGFHAAREKAAAMAEYHSGPSIQLAERIRGMEP